MPVNANLGEKFFALGTEYYYTIDRNDEIPWGIVADLLEDQNGHMWICSENGLLRYDGYDFEVFTHDPDDPTTIGDNDVSLGFATSDGRLVFATDLGISVYHPETKQFLNYSPDGQGDFLMPDVYVMAISESPAGIWVATRTRLYLLPRGSNKIELVETFSTPDGEPENRLRSMVVDDKDQLWIATKYGLMLKTSVNQPATLFSEHITDYVTHLKFDQEKRLWFASTEHGLRYLDVDGTILSVAGALKTFTKEKHILEFFFVEDKEIWLRDNTAKITVFSLTDFKFIHALENRESNPSSPKGGKMGAMWRQDSGLIWIGYSGAGLQIYNPKTNFTRKLYRQSSPALSNTATAPTRIAITKDNKLWFSDKDLYLLDALNSDELVHVSSVRKKIAEHQNLDVEKIVRLFIGAGPENSLFIKTRKPHLYQYWHDDGRLKPILLDAKIDCNHRPKKIAYFKMPYVWVSCYDSGLIRYNLETSEVKKIPLKNELKGSPKVPFLDSRDTLWIPSPSGLFSLLNSHEMGSVELRRHKEFNLKSVSFITEDHDGYLWLDTNVGLFRADLKQATLSFTNISRLLGRPPGQVFGNMYVDKRNRIWSDEGILDTKTMKYHQFLKNDAIKMGTNWIESMASTDDGLLILGHNEGYSMIWPDRFDGFGGKSELSLSKAVVDDTSILGQSFPLQIPAEANRFTVKTALLNYTNPQDVRFAFRLLPDETEWTYKPAIDRSISYTRLPPGDHTLEVAVAERPEDVFETRLTVPLQVARAWYQSYPFYMFVVIALLVIMYLFSYWRTLRLTENKKQLEMLVEQRSQALKESLDELHETQVKLVEVEKQAALGKLVRAIAHEFNTPLGVLKMATSMTTDTISNLLRKTQQAVLGEADAKKVERQYGSASALIEKNITRLSDLVSTFKLVAPEDGEDVLASVELSKLIRVIKSEFQGHVINFNEEQQLEIVTYQTALQRVITELITNAILHNPFSEERPSLIVDISYGFDEENSNLPYWLTVKDNGSGIAEEVLGKIYDPFFTTIADSSAVGLGLHIIYNAVSQQMGGEIICKSTEGEGSMFTIKLPAPPTQHTHSH